MDDLCTHNRKPGLTFSTVFEEKDYERAGVAMGGALLIVLCYTRYDGVVRLFCPDHTGATSLQPTVAAAASFGWSAVCRFLDVGTSGFPSFK